MSNSIIQAPLENRRKIEAVIVQIELKLHSSREREKLRDRVTDS